MNTLTNSQGYVNIQYTRGLIYFVKKILMQSCPKIKLNYLSILSFSLKNYNTPINQNIYNCTIYIISMTKVEVLNL